MTASGAAAARLPRPVKLFGFVSLLNDFASEMIYPLLPAFVTGVLGAGPQALGALDGAAEFAASVVKFAAGRLADRPARRGPLIVLGYAIAVLVRPCGRGTRPAHGVVAAHVGERGRAGGDRGKSRAWSSGSAARNMGGTGRWRSVEVGGGWWR